MDSNLPTKDYFYFDYRCYAALIFAVRFFQLDPSSVFFSTFTTFLNFQRSFSFLELQLKILEEKSFNCFSAKQQLG